MSNEIDWSKAPEGATHYLPENLERDYAACWYKNEHGVWFAINDENRHDWSEDHDEVHIFVPMLIERPQPWNGTGLPPVGTECEYYWAADDSWRSGTCVAHFNGRAVICDADDEDCAERLDAHHVRPIRTPEQIAAEEREKAIAEICRVCSDGISTISHEDASLLYDAGYRKTEAAK